MTENPFIVCAVVLALILSHRIAYLRGARRAFKDAYKAILRWDKWEREEAKRSGANE